MKKKIYDVFLSYAHEDKDTSFVTKLAERLNETIDIWFDKWEMKPGVNLIEAIKRGLELSKKMVCVWSKKYFEKDYTQLELSSKFNLDPLSKERLIIPVKIEKFAPPHIYSSIKSVEYINEADFETIVQEILEAVDWKKNINVEIKDEIFRNKVKTLYSLFGFRVKYSSTIDHLIIDEKDRGSTRKEIIKSLDHEIEEKELKDILNTRKNIIASEKYASFKYIIAALKNIEPDIRSEFETKNIEFNTYNELLDELFPLKEYVKELVTSYKNTTAEIWGENKDCFIRPNIKKDVTYQEMSALDYFAEWRNVKDSNFLVILGDLGCGKTTLLQFITYNLGKNYLKDSIRHPAPVLIPLKDVRKHVSLESLIVSHFSSKNISNKEISFKQFIYLLNQNKIILFFDAFDEMVDHVDWNVSRQNFSELLRASEQNGKVVMTCRTNYFKLSTEQIKDMEYITKHSEVETSLYMDLKCHEGSKVVYLQGFNDNQIKEYLEKIRPKTFENDLKKIKEIHNLEELAHRPLLIHMIIKTLPELHRKKIIIPANLYKRYVNNWIERGEIKEKNFLKFIMLRIAFRMWHSEKSEITYRELIDIIKKKKGSKLKEREIYRRADQIIVSSFLKRDEKANLSFIHQSFLEYFIAETIFLSFTKRKNLNLLKTRRLDPNIIFFLSLNNDIINEIKNILINEYQKNISENSLQILHIANKEKIALAFKLKHNEIPPNVKLSNSNLKRMNLENIHLVKADLRNADLTETNLSNGNLIKADLRSASLKYVNLENSDLQEADLSYSNLTGSKLKNANIKDTNFKKAILKDTLLDQKPYNIKNLIHIVQSGYHHDILTICCNSKVNLMASGSSSGDIYIYHTKEKKILYILNDHKDAVQSLAFSADGKYLVSGSFDQTVRLWDVNKASLIKVYKGHKKTITTVDISHNGEFIVSGSFDKTIRLCNTNNKNNIIKPVIEAKNTVSKVVFSHDNKYIAYLVSDNYIYLWDIKKSKVIHTLKEHSNSVNSLNFSENGKFLVSSDSEGKICLWDINQGFCLSRVYEKHTDSVKSVNFFSDSRFFVSGSGDKMIYIWDVEKSEPIHFSEEHSDEIKSVDVINNGSIAIVSSNKSIRVWDVNNNTSSHVLKGRESIISALDISPDGKYYAFSDSNEFRLCGLTNCNDIKSFLYHSDYISSISFSPDGKYIATASYDKTIRLFDINDEKVIYIFKGHKDFVKSVAFSTDSQFIISGGWDHSVRLWSVKERKQIKIYSEPMDYISSVAFSSNGSDFICGSYDSTIRQWSIHKNECLNTIEHSNPVTTVTYSKNGKIIASGCFDNNIYLWDSNSGKNLQVLEGHSNNISCLDFSSDGNYLASGSTDKTLRLWDIKSGNTINKLDKNCGEIHSLKFSKNCKFIIITDNNSRIQFWDLIKGEIILFCYYFGPGAWIRIMPNNKFDATQEGMRYLQYTELKKLNSFSAKKLIEEFYKPEEIKRLMKEYN